jgi:hypothetical protein
VKLVFETVIRDMFEKLKESKHPEIQSRLVQKAGWQRYLESTWVVKRKNSKEEKLLIPIALWNQHLAALNGLPGINNSSEGKPFTNIFYFY